MAGFPLRKVFCQAITRASKRLNKPRQCQAKGYYLADGTFKCRFHGKNNLDGFNKKRYTDETRINQLHALYQFRNKTREEVEEYYHKKVKPRIGTTEKSRYFIKQSYKRKNPYRNNRGQETQSLSSHLDAILLNIKKKQGIK